MKKKLASIIIFTFCSLILFSQNPFSVNLQFKHGLTGIDKILERNHTGNPKQSVRYGTDISLGAGFNFYYTEDLDYSISGAILWNYYSFQRIEVSNIPFLTSSTITQTETQYFQSHSILVPIKISRQLDFISVSFGIFPRFRRKMKMTFEYSRPSSPSVNLQFESYQFNEGEIYTVFPSTPGRIKFERNVDLQFLLGVNYDFNDQLTFSLEFRDVLLQNKLIWFDMDITNPNAGTLSVGFSYRIFYK